MIWSNWSDFFAMGGYAFYVWGSYGLTAVLMIAEVVLVLRRRRNVVAQLARSVDVESERGVNDESTQ